MTTPKLDRLSAALAKATCREDYEAAVYAELRAGGSSGSEARKAARRIVARYSSKPKARKPKTMHVAGVGSVPVPASSRRRGLPPEQSAALARRMGVPTERRVVHTPFATKFGVSLTAEEAEAVDAMPAPRPPKHQTLPNVGRLPKAESEALAKRMGLRPSDRSDVGHTPTRQTFGANR